MERMPHFWAVETPRKRFASPYRWGTGENLLWLKNSLFGPSFKYQELTEFIGQEIQLNRIEPQVRIAFIGDVMPMHRKIFRVGDGLKSFLKDVDYLVLNFEGVISTDRRVFNALRHDESILGLLGEIFPAEQTVVGFTNNHAADCGWNEYQSCYNLLRNSGYNVCGRRDQPSIFLQDRVQITACSFWSNQPGEFISRYEEAREESNKDALFKILYPHWGYEMQLYPDPRQIEFGKELLTKWDMILGHHSHCPQPVIQDKGKLLAYSLGDFCFATRFDRFHHGIIVKAEIGPNSQGKWQAGKVEWKFTKQNSIVGGAFLIDVSSKCRFFSNLE